MELTKSSLQAGSTSSGWITIIEEIVPQKMKEMQFRVLAVLVPQDVERMKLLRQEMSLDQNKNKRKDEFENLLMRSSSSVLMQIKEYHPEERKLEVRTTSLDAL